MRFPLYKEVIPHKMTKPLKLLMLITDVGFLIYWLVTWLHLVPDEYLYKDYKNEIMMAQYIVCASGSFDLINRSFEYVLF